MNIINPNARALYGAFQLPTRRWDSRGHQMLMNKRRTSILRTLLTTIVATVMLAMPQNAQAQTKEAYVVKSTDGKTLTFYYDTLKASRQDIVWGIYSMQTDKNGTFPIWAGTFANPDYTLDKVDFDLSFKDFRPKTTSSWFFNCNALKQIMGMENLNTSEVTDMNRMFRMCSSLTELDLRSFDTRNVTNMREMFADCLSLTKLDLTKFDTSNVTDMSEMFICCLDLPSLDLRSFDTSNVTTMSGMFSYCKSLAELDLGKFDTRNVTKMDEMFSNCNLLTVLDLRSFDTRNVTKMNGMFFGCLALTRLDLTRFDTRNVTNMSHMFFYCLALPVLDVTKFDTRNVTRMDEMFSSCSSLTELDLRSFDTRNVTNIEGMFSACLSLTKIYSKDKRIGKLKKKFKQMREKPVTTPEELRTYLRNNY